ncbi:hypothetical protein SASC598O02_007580 [Snodgrassella alvi SCGC AB-598-O02]|nr:hypothetical protein [Snodgrassella alvi]KES10812.1 hypothetical protein SASC598O02_007580 [Snodgrassella alvi SCGC AB-598-O02]
MSHTQQIYMVIGIMMSIIFIFALFFYLLMKLNIFLLKSLIYRGKMTDERLTFRYNDMKIYKDNKSHLIKWSIITGLFGGGPLGGILFHFLFKKMYRDYYEIYKQAMIERNLPL